MMGPKAVWPTYSTKFLNLKTALLVPELLLIKVPADLLLMEVTTSLILSLEQKGLHQTGLCKKIYSFPSLLATFFSLTT